MKNDYFFHIQKKYNMKISKKIPFVIRFDGKNVTKDTNINLLEKYNGSFFDSLEKTAKYFSHKYSCFSIFGTDEISFIVEDPLKIIYDLEPAGSWSYSHELLALFSQYFFDYFNTEYKVSKIFWHGKCFSISDEKKKSYIKYRSGIIKNVLITYFLKHKHLPFESINLEEKIKMCERYADFRDYRDIVNGVLYYDGEKIDLDEYVVNGNINFINSCETKKIEYPNIDIDDIDIELL